MAQQSINIPQVLVFLVFTFLAVRWYRHFSKPSEAGTRAAPNRTARPINLAQIDQIAQMFPQLSRRDIAWDLQRNGGNASATTERVLGGRGLDTVRSSSQEDKVTLLTYVTGTTIFHPSNAATSRRPLTYSASTCEAYPSRSHHALQPRF
jgi:hypothetical protein